VAVRAPGLLGRSILTSVLVAVVGIVATAVVTLDATQSTLDRERVRSQQLDQAVVERLLHFGRTDHDWAAADPLVHKLATGDRDVVVTGVDRTRLASSSADLGPLSDPSAVLDPLAEVLDQATGRLPVGGLTLSLPDALLDARPGGKAVLELTAHPGQTDVCLPAGVDIKAMPADLHGPALVTVECDDRDFAAGVKAGTGPEAALAGLQSDVASDEHACLRRRGVTSLLISLGTTGAASPSLLTVSVPAESAHGAGAAAVTTAWKDCATASLTHRLAPLLAPRALLFISETRTTQRGLLDRIGRSRLLLALGAVLLVVVGVGLVGSRRLRRPLHGLTAATQRMAGGDLGARVTVTGSDELADLGRSFNEMADALSSSEDQRRQMVADVSHELRTPLANIRGYLEAGRDDVLPRDRAWTVSLLEEASLLQHVIDDLQVLSEADAGRLVITPDTDDVIATVDLAIQAIRAQAAARGVRVERVGSATSSAPHDRLRMRQAVANLLSNAVRYAPAGSTVEVGVTDGDPVRVSVRDHGPGIPPESLPHVFDRFYRADASRSRETGGSGLGLAIVERVVRGHRGSVEAANAPGGGAVVSVSLPSRRPSPSGSSSAP
jgi:two-component system sensor histidine kinase BaeS